MIRTYKTTSHSDARRVAELRSGRISITWHNGLKWYVVEWYEESGD